MTATDVPTADVPLTRPATPRRPKRRREGAAWVFLSPWVLGATVLTLLPMAVSLYLSFTDYNLFNSPHWVGLRNYTQMFTEDPRYWRSVIATLSYVVIAVPLQLGLALVVALALKSMRRGKGFYRSAFYAPSLLGASMSIALVWRAIFNDGGTVDHLFGTGGWVTRPGWALLAVALLTVWQFGAPMVIFLAGLQQIPGELYEAAEVDGASRIKQFWHITLPHLKDAIVLSTLLRAVWEFNNVDLLYTLTGGGPAGETTTLPLYVANTSVDAHNFGYASALTTVAFVILLFFSIIYLRLSKFGGQDK